MSVQILQGDARTMLATLPAESVQCVVTSPPYFQLRDYGVDGQIGLEATPAEFIATLVGVFDEVRRVLRPDGVCFVNIGDSYAGSGKGPTGHNGIGDQEQRQGFTGGRGATSQVWRGDPDGRDSQKRVGPVQGVKPKSLLLIPQRFAIAMQDNGWYVRSQIAWCKTSAMPESVKDRPTSAWEPIYMFTKSARYFWDQQAVRTPAARPGDGGHFGGQKGRDYTPQPGDPNFRNGSDQWSREFFCGTGANLRNYWLLGPEPSREEHYAAFPSEIPRRCILAASRPGDTVLDPFLGSGTTALVADQLGRNAIGCELSPTYAEMARRRITNDGPMFADVTVAV